MGSVVLTGDTSGSVVLTVPAVAGSNTATIAAATGTHFPFTAGTAVNSTSGTSIDFTSIPSWVKRITVMFNGVSTNGTSSYLVQLGSGSITATGYTGSGAAVLSATTPGVSNSTAGFLMFSNTAATVMQAVMTIVSIGSNSWVSSHSGSNSNAAVVVWGGGAVTLSGVLDRVRITTVNGTDAFDAGSINILYE